MTAATVIPASDIGRALLSRGAWNEILREAGSHAGEQWLATALPLRFRRDYAMALGYSTSQRRDPWADRYPGLPPTYDERKRQWQGHDDPLVWTGRLRASVFRSAVARATAARDAVTVRLGLGRLNVGPPGREVQLAAGSMVRRVLLSIPTREIQDFSDQFLAHVAERLGAIGAPVKSKASLPPAPPELAERQRQASGALIDRARGAEATFGDIRGRMAERIAASRGRYDAWRAQSGGSAPVGGPFGGPSRSPAERTLAHRLQSRASYQRHRAAINARRRLRGAVGRSVGRTLGGMLSRISPS